jgi:predicted lactoylglutathione lyase
VASSVFVNQPVKGHDFMYFRSFQDLGGHMREVDLMAPSIMQN